MSEARADQAPINVACAASRSHIPHAAAMLSSLFVNNPTQAFVIYLLHDDDVTVQDIDAIRRLAQDHDNTLIPMQPGPAIRGKVPISARFGAAAWFRVLLPELLPDVERVLYLDVDLLILDRVEPLWHWNLDGRLIGAVTNPLYPGMLGHVLVDLKLPRLADYFNSGVLLMDLGACRRSGLTGQVLEMVKRHPRLTRFADQDPLNLSLADRALKLPLRWNVQAAVYDLPIWWLKRFGLEADDIRQARQHPAILHYSGAWKPWEARCNHPRRKLYAQYRDMTPWSRWAPQDLGLTSTVLRQIPAAWQVCALLLFQKVSKRLRRQLRRVR